MKVHIAKRNDTFESIAHQYGVSLQDLIGMNTHINYLAGLVPGLKIKLPDINRKDGLSFEEKVQTHFPKVDTQAVDLHSGSTDQPEQPAPLQETTASHQTSVSHNEGNVEEAKQVPLKQVEDSIVADGIKVDIPQPHISQTSNNQAAHPSLAQQFSVPGVSQSQGMTQQGAAYWENNGGSQAAVGESGVTVNQTPYQHSHNQSEPYSHVQTHQQTTYLGEAPLGQPFNYPYAYQQAPMAQQGYYDRPPGLNPYSAYIPGPATIIYHGVDPRGWEARQELPDFGDFPIVYPGGYGYPARGASPCTGNGYNPMDYLSFYYPDEASYWAAFPWGIV
ncbi:MAG: LysM peptidoglycan-binding domain-containing protein [Turicibacter sp.]|nr:LysM peptidoglycan-binding domain-containing protein [Turicibacter sp.]